ncbi:MAG: glycosyltransferase family 4 protein [Ferruginibacter sp.]
MKEITGKKILIGVPPKAHVSLAMDEFKALQALGYQCYAVPYGRNNQSVGILNKLFSTFVKAGVLVTKLYAVKPAILYLNSRFEKAGSTRDFISVLLVRLFYWNKVSIVIKSHGSEAHKMDKESWFIRKLVLPYLTRAVNGWFFLSAEEKMLVSGYNPVLAEKIYVLPNIIDPSRCRYSNSFDADHGFPPTKFKILFVGRMVREKGIFDILNALPEVIQKEDVLFIFVGNGNDLEALKTEAAARGFEKYTRFMGFIPDAECDHFYANCQLLVYPTYDTEGFAMALFKSIAVGLPVITTRIRAAKDHLKEPENVIWVPEKDPASIADAINRIQGSEQLRRSIGENNKLLGQKFSAANVAAAMHSTFESIKNRAL